MHASVSLSPRLSIIVVSWNVERLLRECLQSVFAEARAAAIPVEVIVVDNDSRDGSVTMVRKEFPAVTVIANRDNVGFGRANNQALPLAQGPYLLLLNPDTAVPEGAFAALMRVLDERRESVVVGPRLVNPDGSLQRWTAGAFPTLRNVASHYLFLSRFLPQAMCPPSLYLVRDVTEDLDVDWISGACMPAAPERRGGLHLRPELFHVWRGHGAMPSPETRWRSRRLCAAYLGDPPPRGEHEAAAGGRGAFCSFLRKLFWTLYPSVVALTIYRLSHHLYSQRTAD